MKASPPVALKPAIVTARSNQPPGSVPIAERERFPCSFSLNNLIRLDWSQRSEIFSPHGPGPTSLSRIGLNGQEYQVEAIEHSAQRNPFVSLSPDRRYYVVPIYEEGQAPDVPHRFLLVRDQNSAEEPGPHIFVVEPLGLPAPGEPFAHLHIIGGEEEDTALSPVPHTAGLVEAILTPMGVATVPQQSDTKVAPRVTTLPNGALVEAPPPPAPDSALAMAQPSQPENPDDDLLRSIDNFNQAIGYRPAIEQDLTPLRNCLLAHLRQKYGWEIIPIVLNTTQFDEKQGHRGVGLAHLSSVGEGVIVAVQSNGYTRAAKVVRDAQVIVNRQPDRIARLNKLVSLRRSQMYLEIIADQDMIIDEVINDAVQQVGGIDVIYSLLAILATANPPQIRYLAEQLNAGKTTSSLIRESLGQTPSLHLRYLRRTPEMYVALRGAVKPLDTLRQILIAEAAQRSGTNYYLNINRAWLNDLLRQLRPVDPTDEDYASFANDIARRMELITFTPEFAANTSQ